jgi:hypothetical protein
MNRGRRARRRRFEKKKRIDSLEMIKPRDEKFMHDINLHNNSVPIFFSGRKVTDAALLPQKITNGKLLSAVDDFNVVNTTLGARLISDSGDTVFTLIPRRCAIEKNTRVNEKLLALHALEKAKKVCEMRGKARIPVAETDAKYITVGLKPCRGTTGVIESWPEKFEKKNRETILNMMAVCEDVAKAYMESETLRGLREAQQYTKWLELKDVSPESIWGSLACGRNYFLNAHVDDDFFYSLTTIVSRHGLHDDIDKYRLDTEISNYFVFPEQGVLVALRPGDILIFNPLYQHCISSRSSAFENKDVFCLSLYLKTAIIGGNDNQKKLQQERKIT